MCDSKHINKASTTTQIPLATEFGILSRDIARLLINVLVKKKKNMIDSIAYDKNNVSSNFVTLIRFDDKINLPIPLILPLVLR